MTLESKNFSYAVKKNGIMECEGKWMELECGNLSTENQMWHFLFYS